MRLQLVLGAVAGPVTFQLFAAGVSHLALHLLRPRDRPRKRHASAITLSVGTLRRTCVPGASGERRPPTPVRARRSRPARAGVRGRRRAGVAPPVVPVSWT